jgi:hypothetical protein
MAPGHIPEKCSITQLKTCVTLHCKLWAFLPFLVSLCCEGYRCTSHLQHGGDRGECLHFRVLSGGHKVISWSFNVSEGLLKHLTAITVFINVICFVYLVGKLLWDWGVPSVGPVMFTKYCHWNICVIIYTDVKSYLWYSVCSSNKTVVFKSYSCLMFLYFCYTLSVENYMLELAK